MEKLLYMGLEENGLLKMALPASVVGLEAVQTEQLTLVEPGLVLGDRLTALGAGHVAEDACLLGHGTGGLGEGEHLLHRGGEEPVLPGGAVQAAVPGFTATRRPRPLLRQ